MAGDWIKIEHALLDKPEVVQMASKLGIDQDAVTGKMLRLWVWADQQSANGNALTVTETFLDRVTFATGFAQALRSVGWLAGEDGNLSLPNFERHNGKTAKTRAKGRQRTQVSRSRNGASVTEPSPKALPEKRREEKSIMIYSPGADVLIPESIRDDETIAAIGRWVEYVNGNETHKSIEQNSPQEQELFRMIASWQASPDQRVEAISTAIANSWANLQKPRGGSKPQTSGGDYRWAEFLAFVRRLDLSKPYTETITNEFGEKFASVVKKLGVPNIARADDFGRTQFRTAFLKEMKS